MADRLESLVLDILLRDRASEGLSKIGGKSGDAAKNVNVLTERLNDLSRKSAEARVALKGDKEAQAALDKFDAKLIAIDHRIATSEVKVSGAARAMVELNGIESELDNLGKKSADAEAAVGSGGLSGPGGMGALIGAGVALSPIIATLGVGLGGLAAAAYGVISPVLKAGTATAQARKELAGLDPAQRAAYRSLGALKTQFREFSASLQPQVLTLFNQGIGIAGHLMHDIQPVAAATGKAFSGFLGQLDKEFQSQRWQQFFAFMATTAATDVQLVGNAFIAWSNALPPLLENLQGVATATATVVTKAGQLTGVLATAANKADHFGSSGQKAHGFWQTLTKDVTGWLELRNLWDPAAKGADKAAAATGRVGAQAHTAAIHVQTLAQMVSALTAAENKSLSPLLGYASALITQANDAAALNKALQASHDKIGLKTAAERASFSAATTYAQDLLNTAAAAAKSHHGIDDVISSLRSELPALERAKGGGAAYSAVVQQLVGWLRRLQAIKTISEAIHVSGTGVWSVTPGKIGLPGGTAGGPFAAGGLVTGGIPGRDSVLARVMPGEVIVPTKMVSAGFVDHLRGLLPGFAAGGVVGSHGLPGMGPWLRSELAATEHSIARSVAAAIVSAINSARASSSAGFAPGPAASGSALAAQNFAKSILWAYGWGMNQWPPLLSLWNRESGWNAWAVNPTSGAYGIPQSLGHGHPYNLGDYANQVRWGLSYISATYRSPANAWAHELANNWYGTGTHWARPGWAWVGERGPELIKFHGGEQVHPHPESRWDAGYRPPTVINYNYHITITLPPGSDREQGRRIVNYIKAFEKGSGPAWRKW